MSKRIRKRLAERKRKIAERLCRRVEYEPASPVLSGTNAKYELADRARGIAQGGIGLMHRLASECGLIDAIDSRLHLLKVHLPYHESDHVLNIAYNVLCGGDCLDDIERRRNDEVFLDALGADRIPDPTTAGDFCRRFSPVDALELQYAIDIARLNVWRRQPSAFFERATIDMDGTLVTTTGQCKEGMDFTYKGDYGYHPLLVTLAETGEVLRVINRPGNRPSHEGAWAAVDDAIEFCRDAGFRSIVLRGDTDFTQTKHLDGWSQEENLRFYFGVDAMPNLEEIADNLPQNAWKRLVRRRKEPRKEEPRRRPKNLKERKVIERGYKNLRLVGEEVAEFSYRPGACNRSYRMVVLKKHIVEEEGGLFLDQHDRYFFYLSNDDNMTAREVVFQANDRCNQENLISQLKNGVCALRAPVDNLVSNWAYMVMAALAWTLKAWFALWPTEKSEPKRKRLETAKRTVLAMEFKRFASYFIDMPAQIVRTGRQLIYRLLSWNPWQTFFFTVNQHLRC